MPWKGKEKKIFGQAVCYDPPRPRYNGAFGVYEPPRDVLKAIPGVRAGGDGAHQGSRLVLRRRRRRAARRIRSSRAGPRTERIEEAKSTGADAIVSACPWCERNFIDATSARWHEDESIRHDGTGGASPLGEEIAMEISQRSISRDRRHRRRGQCHATIRQFWIPTPSR